MATVTLEDLRKKAAVLRAELAKYSPDQARDDHGRFAAGGAGPGMKTGNTQDLAGSKQTPFPKTFWAMSPEAQSARVSYLSTHWASVKAWAYHPKTKRMLLHTAAAAAISAGIEIPEHAALHHAIGYVLEHLSVTGTIAASSAAVMVKHVMHYLGLTAEHAKEWVVGTLEDMIKLHSGIGERVASGLMRGAEHEAARTIIGKVARPAGIDPDVTKALLQSWLYVLKNLDAKQVASAA